MLDKYDACNQMKHEINRYINLLNSNKQLYNEQNIRGIAKRILLLKIIFLGENEDGHYRKCMIYDLLLLMHSLTQNSIRNFYSIYRSFIENFIRSILQLEDNDETGINQIFKQVKEYFSVDKEIIEILSYIEGEYGKCCDYVHSNINANLDIFEYYEDILCNDEMNEKKLSFIINQVLTMMQKITLFIILVKTPQIDQKFYRKKQELKFLLGEKNFILYEKRLNNFLEDIG